MADEAQIRTSLQIQSGNVDYQSRPTQFNADVAGAKGPVPGAVAIATGGTDLDFSELTQPGLCRIQNLDSTNFVEIGIWDGSTFHPLVELLATETFVFRLSSNITTVRAKADTAAVDILVEAFEV